MEPLQTYEVPILHPLVVHFPIALLLAGAAALLVWAFRPSAFWYRCAGIAYLVGSLGAVAAYLTGEAAEDFAEEVPIVEEIVELHETLGIVTLAASLLTLVVLVILRPALITGRTVDDSPPGPTIRTGVAVLGLVTAFLVWWTGHLGGLMVWGVPR